MGFLVAALAALVFGAADQYLGGLWSVTHIGFWTLSVSAMSAPWQLLPFLAGIRSRDGTRGAAMGLAVTLAALLGYFAMGLSPIEHVSLSHVALPAFVRSQLHVIVPGLFTGPLFGWFGWRYRATGSWVWAATIGLAFALEPVARQASGQPLGSGTVELVEVALGIGVLALMAAQRVTTQRRI